MASVPPQAKKKGTKKERESPGSPPPPPIEIPKEEIPSGKRPLPGSPTERVTTPTELPPPGAGEMRPPGKLMDFPSPTSKSMEVTNPGDIHILETVEEIQDRRKQVLGRYDAFNDGTRVKRTRLEDSRRFQYFKRDADELESWINEKLQTALDESYKDPTNLQAKIQKHQAFEAEVTAHANAIEELDRSGNAMIGEHHFASEVIRVSEHTQCL